ncbi:MAG: DUF3000 domain-containing protein [Actinomycetaceae bacterium]|nr:DUF3000 domain-containing protein [Actinomycetaceae bacterium]
MPETTTPEVFLQALDSLKGHEFRREIHISQIPPPKRIAPWAVALMAEINDSDNLDPETHRGEARFVLLYDPEGQNSWNGTMRIVAHAMCPVESVMADDPLLGEVAWSWLVDSLNNENAPFHSLTGTVTRVYNESFTGIDLEGLTTNIELRASWSPADPDCSTHLQAWANFIASLSGLDPEGVSSLPRRTS